MMKYYVVDAFADRLFEGNPAGICISDRWLSDNLMKSVTLENNLAETAFLVREEENYRLRWFTPGGEIDLCGHATLAAAFILSKFFETTADKFVFETLSGELIVKCKGEIFELDFPGYALEAVPVTDAMEKAIGARPAEAWRGRDLICVFDEESKIINAEPDNSKVIKLEGLSLHITARGSKYDCITRSFAPKMGIEEDSVCGLGHYHVIPLWSKKLNKNTLTARQASKRGGTLYCQNCGDRVKLSGKAVLYSVADIFVDEISESI